MSTDSQKLRLAYLFRAVQAATTPEEDAYFRRALATLRADIQAEEREAEEALLRWARSFSGPPAPVLLK